MKSPLLSVLCVLSLAVSMSGFSQHNKIRTTKKSSWVHPVTYNEKAIPEEGQETSSYYLLIDEQENTVFKEDYYHYVYKILTSEGLQAMSDLTFDFDPTYQELIFHEVKIIRDGVSINKLTNNIRTIQREQSMDRYLYDGSQTAIINLNDVRKGDIVEYAFTRKGNNPVYSGHISRTIYFDYNVSYEKSYKRIVLPAAKAQTLKFPNGDELEYEKEVSGNTVSYTWKLERVKGVINDKNLPEWYDPYRHVMLTDFKSWQEVAVWADGLFAVTKADQTKISALAKSTFSEGELTQYALQVIRFVQDEVRYLGFETGLNSHKPHAPLKVYEQRFGDCKDKSLLLVTLLRARNIEAYPVLVSTTLRDKVADRLPAANLFNHCVVKFILGDKPFFIDPTISNQGGEIGNIHFPDYGKGLIVSSSSKDLETFPEQIASTTTEVQTFDLLTIGGEAMLTIRTSYTGNDADYQRGEFARNSAETVQKNYQDYYANLYPDITKWEDLSVDDDRKDNVLIVQEKYKIPSFWKPSESDPQIMRCEVYPQTMEGYFNVSKSILRTGPYRLSYPVDYYHHVHLHLPEDWNIQAEDEVIETDFYQYEREVKLVGKEISRFTHYKTKSNHIPSSHFEKFVADHDKMMNNLSYQLTYNKTIAEAGSSKTPGLIVTIISLIVSAYLVFVLYKKYNPKPELAYLRGTPIGGWLVLVGIGVTLTPLRILIDIGQNPDAVSGAGWMGWLAAKRYGLFAFTLFTHIFNIFNLLFTVFVAILFYERRSSFPRLLSIELAMTFVITLADTIISRSIVDTPGDIGFGNLMSSLVPAAIWIPYLNISLRVKETFVLRYRRNDDDEGSDHNALQPAEYAER